jgi:hypothetical protein
VAIIETSALLRVVPDSRLPKAVERGPGLCKWYEGRAEFTLPQALLRQLGSETLPPAAWLAVLAQIVNWAIHSFLGKVPDGWQLPSLGEVQGWLEAGLTVQVRHRLCQGELVHHEGPEGPRLAIRFPLTSFTLSLNQGRQAAIAALITAASRQFPMVRFRPQRVADVVTIVAETDLTGAPAACLPILVPSALEALHLAVRRVLTPLSLAADSGVPSRALDSNLGGFPPARFGELCHE